MPKQHTLKAVVSDGDTIPRFEDWNPGEAYMPADKSGVGFLCPCGCGRETFLSLDGAWGGKQWRLESADPLTISPSIHDTGCGAHFFVRAGKVDFC